MLSDNREFYDLCRKYKYFYNAYKEVEKMKDIYWSKFIQKAYKDVEKQLKEVEDEIISLVLNEIIDEESTIQIKRDVVQRWDIDMHVPTNYRVIIYDNDFVKKMEKYLNKRENCKCVDARNLSKKECKKFKDIL